MPELVINTGPLIALTAALGCVEDVVACVSKMRNAGVWMGENLEAAVRAELHGR